MGKKINKRGQQKSQKRSKLRGDSETVYFTDDFGEGYRFGNKKKTRLKKKTHPREEKIPKRKPRQTGW